MSPFANTHYPPMSEIAATTTFRTWMCVVCGFIYDEAQGLPEEGIAPGTRWEDVPDAEPAVDEGGRAVRQPRRALDRCRSVFSRPTRRC